MEITTTIEQLHTAVGTAFYAAALKAEKNSQKPETLIYGICNLSEFLGASRSSCIRYIKKGIIPFYRVGSRKLVFDRSEVLKALKEVSNV